MFGSSPSNSLVCLVVIQNTLNFELFAKCITIEAQRTTSPIAERRRTAMYCGTIKLELFAFKDDLIFPEK